VRTPGVVEVRNLPSVEGVPGPWEDREGGEESDAPRLDHHEFDDPILRWFA
jgi:hypothetical protein